MSLRDKSFTFENEMLMGEIEVVRLSDAEAAVEEAKRAYLRTEPAATGNAAVNSVAQAAKDWLYEYETHSLTDGDFYRLFRAIIAEGHATPDVKVAISQLEASAPKESAALIAEWNNAEDYDVVLNVSERLVVALVRSEREVAEFKRIRDLLVRSLCRATGASEDTVRDAPLTCAVAAAKERDELQREVARLRKERE